jgi:hypothetical protein
MEQEVQAVSIPRMFRVSMTMIVPRTTDSVANMD